MDKGKNQKNMTDGMSFFIHSDLFKKKENIYLLKVFGLSILLLAVSDSIFTTIDRAISYFLSLISSVLIVNGYDKAKKGNKY